MSIIEALQRWLNNYEPLKDQRLNVDFLPADAGSYSLDVVPCKEWVKHYIDGSGERQFLFNLSSREAFDDTLCRQMENVGFYEAFSEWLEGQTKNGILPLLGDGKTARKVEAVTSGYPFVQGTNTAKYQIQCKLTYFQERKR